MVPRENSDDVPPPVAQPAAAPPPLGQMNEGVIRGRTNFDTKYHVSHRWGEQMSARVRTASFYVGRQYVNNNLQVCRSSPEDQTFLFLGLVEVATLHPDLKGKILREGADMHDPTTGGLPSHFAIFVKVNGDNFVGFRIIRPDL